MREPRLGTFTGRREFQAAILEVLATSRHSITAVDHDFESWPLETALGEETLRRALRRGATLRLLVSHPEWLERHGQRFMRVRREYPHAIDCRAIPSTLRVDESALLADRQHLVRRAHWESFTGRLVIASPSEVEGLVDRYETVWDESAPCLAATTLGL